MASHDGVIPAGKPAPPFSLPVAGRAGEQVTVPDPAAPGLMLIAFHKNTCATCRMSFPYLQRLHEQVAGAGGRVLGLSQDGEPGALAFAAELSLSMPILIDGPDYPVSRRYGLVSVPTLYLIDRSGTILRNGTGFDRDLWTLMGADLAASVGAARPALYGAGESVPDFRPG